MSELPPDPTLEPGDAVHRRLLVGSIASGVGCFLAAVWASMLVTVGPNESVEFGVPLLIAMVLFLVLLVACILLGYVAARRRPPRD